MIVDSLFLTILNMSITGSFVIIIIVIARLLLKKAPKIISYCLWAVAGIRLLFPFSIESIWSIMPFGAQPIPTNAIAPYITDAVLLAPGPSLAHGWTWLTIIAIISLVGAAAMFGYGMLSYFALKSKLRGSVHMQENIYEAANIKSPFVLGFLSPKIYLPIGLSEQEREHVVLHEQIHIKRFDHIVKFVAYFILCLHWFNPLVWLAFKLMVRDMEMSCDERVLKEMGIEETKEGYSMLLVSLAMEKQIVAGSPLAFGESSIKQRVKNVLNLKKNSRLVSIVAVVMVAALSMGLITSPVTAAIQEEVITSPPTSSKDGWLFLCPPGF